ncbi:MULTISPECIES: hypothetical protein [unclassified Herbaspirillum]|uniref:hypothetical protein n=1 Tax=unclassified Herbaspirillum TaxID=2624150 RepID=UPI00116EF9F5|nr:MULTISPECIES: hypothetical protein [unclassified Herbaspirillum]MBB5391407.1 hypothetical protein [Herbaspirillum sp. SJZ102]TQK12908.1 hypothetical protein FB599_0315 [Herbaspirillum sp. SJZ130]TQK14912.1 hypothetical protein FB598_0253 [Herbaspirillum sp. SJZ106]TWC67267.1 hypothetical protein FB597_10477 [Herbaspirillum sp. SJZ099]
MSDLQNDPGRSNPMGHPPEQPAGDDGSPRFGRLLAVLICAVLLIVAITFGSEAYFS